MFGTTFFPLEKLIEPIVWTLAIEVKFYIICAVLFHFFRTDPRKLFQASIIFLSVAAILSHYLPWREIPWRMDVDIGLSVVPFMFNGLFFSLLYFNKIGRAEALVGVFCASAAFLVGPCDWFVAIDKGLPSWMLAAAVFVVALRKHDGLPILTTPIARFFGDISYPLYAVHVAIASAALAYAPYGMAEKFVAFVISAVAAAWLIHVSIEQPSIRLSKRTFGKMSNKRVTA